MAKAVMELDSLEISAIRGALATALKVEQRRVAAGHVIGHKAKRLERLQEGFRKLARELDMEQMAHPSAAVRLVVAGMNPVLEEQRQDLSDTLGSR